MVATHYRWDFVGLSTDDKPTADNPKVTNGSTFYESDTSKYYIWYNDQWYEKIVNGGGSTEPTSSETRITAFDNTTKTITGSGFGEQGDNSRVYMLLREYNDYTYLSVASWKDNEIKLSSSIDLSTIEGTTSINIVTNDGIWSNKFLVEGTTAVEGYGKLYIQEKCNGQVSVVELTSNSDVNKLSGTAQYSKSFTIGSTKYFRDEVVGIQLGSDYTATNTPSTFLAYCSNLNQPVVLPDTITSVYSEFMLNCRGFNSIVVANKATSFGNKFMQDCVSFNQPLNFESATTLGDAFLYECHSFNSPIAIDDVTTIGTNFLGYDYKFNQELTLTKVGSLGNYFLRECYSFNSKISSFASTLTTLPTYFIYRCYSFNQPLDLSQVTSFGEYFMYGCFSFNSQIMFNDDVTVVGNYFLGECYSFNDSCVSSPLDSATTIGNYVLKGCYSFNKPITLANAVTIGTYFMASCYSLNSTLSIVSSDVTSIGGYFLNLCYAFNKLYTETDISPNDSYSLSTTLNDTRAYTDGITVEGSGATSWCTNLPNSSRTNYRKLINGTV